jgi:hypothetical protein
MWSVNTVPKRGDASAASRSASVTGWALGRISNRSGVVVLMSVLISGPFTRVGTTVPVTTAERQDGSRRDP